MRKMWSLPRGLLKKRTFGDIKAAAGASGLNVPALSHLNQTLPSASKEQLLDAVDKLFEKLSMSEQDDAARDLFEHMWETALERVEQPRTGGKKGSPTERPQLEAMVGKRGYEFRNGKLSKK